MAAIGPEAPQHYDSDIGQIHEELVKARADHDEYAARLTSISSSNGHSSTALDTEAEQSIATDPGLSSLKQSLLARKAALVSQMANLTPSHPLYKQDQAELAKIDASLETSTQELRAKAATRIEEQLRTDLDRTAGLEARLNAQLAQMTRAAAGATPKLQRSSDLANDITRLQTRFNAVDEQLQNQTLEDSAPGMAHLAEAAVPPTYPSVAGVIRNALLLLFGFISLGLAAAVVAHKMDPRIYVAADVEQLLGYAPMAQLPDFDEVTDEAAEEHLLRLATSIEFACKEGQLTSCVFTGAGPEVGVTTLVKRVKEMLVVLGKETVLLDAAGPVPAEHRTETELQRSARATALMPRAADGTATDSGSLMLTDTAPLTVSAESEYMARRADCTILVLESGKTTRAQIRAAANSLQRLNAAAVGFVLNRVSLANADESFRRSVSEVERHLRVQGRTTARTAAQNPRIMSEAAHASPAREVPVLAEKAAAPKVFASTAAPKARRAAPEPVPLAPGALRDIDPVSLWFAGSASQPAQKPVAMQKPELMPDVPAVFSDDKREPQSKLHSVQVIRAIPRGVAPVSMPAEKPAAAVAPEPVTKSTEGPKSLPVPWTGTPPKQQPPGENPWWLTDAPAHADHAVTQPGTPRMGTWHSVAAHNEQRPAAAEVPEEEEADDEAPTHLSGLKSILFSMGIKDLRPWKEAERNANRSGSGHGNGDGNGNGAHADAAPADPEQTTVLETSVPWPEPEPGEAKGEEAPSRRPAPRWVTAEPEFLPPPVEETDKGKGSHWKQGKYDKAGDLDGIQILPAKRGQYKR